MLKGLAKPVLLALVIVVTAFGQKMPAALSIESSVAPVLSLNTSTVSLGGTAAGRDGITRITWQTSNGATGVASGAAHWMATDIPLAQGTTTIVMRAYDSKGASAWFAFVAVRP